MCGSCSWGSHSLGRRPINTTALELFVLSSNLCAEYALKRQVGRVCVGGSLLLSSRLHREGALRLTDDHSPDEI